MSEAYTIESSTSMMNRLPTELKLLLLEHTATQSAHDLLALSGTSYSFYALYKIRLEPFVLPGALRASFDALPNLNLLTALLFAPHFSTSIATRQSSLRYWNRFLTLPVLKLAHKLNRKVTRFCFLARRNYASAHFQVDEKAFALACYAYLLCSRLLTNYLEENKLASERQLWVEVSSYIASWGVPKDIFGYMADVRGGILMHASRWDENTGELETCEMERLTSEIVDMKIEGEWPLLYIEAAPPGWKAGSQEVG